MLPFALGYSVWLVLGRPEGKTRRLISVFAVFFLVGAIAQSFAGGPYADIKTLIADSLVLKSGGLISGGFALLLGKAISKIGANILLIAAGIAVVLSTFNISPKCTCLLMVV